MLKHSLRYIILLLVITLSVHVQGQALSTDAQIDRKVAQIIKQMTLDEKIAMLHAKGQFTSAGVPRLGIPDLQSADGPLGVREEVNTDWSPRNLTTDSATFFPNGSALAATWNPLLALRYGQALGEEAKARGKSIILAPAFNIARTPLCGRTYEYLSEDPLLNSMLAVQAVKGIQQWDVAACVKHFAMNNQETDRMNVNVLADERAVREIYLPAFKAAVEQGHAWTVMSAYNKFRGHWCAESNYLLNRILKREWGFRGAVISDWGGTHNTLASAQSGLDLEMGTDKPYDQFYFAAPLMEAVEQGKLSIALIDEKVRRLLWVIFKTQLSGRSLNAQMNSRAHSKIAYNIATEAIVLLKNDRKALPLNAGGLKDILVIGDNATRSFQREGVGAGVKAKYEVTLLEGIKRRFKNANVTFEKGYEGNYRTDWTEAKEQAANQPNEALINTAVAKAKSAKLVILCVGGNRYYETESEDRKSLDLPFGQQLLIDAVLTANPNTIVVFTGGAPYDLGRLKQKAHTIVWNWYNGLENGNALAAVLAGDVNPSGKLPFSFPSRLEDSPAHALKTYPGNNFETEYKEGILVGYRWFDTKKIAPLYPFGYGLSYTEFNLSMLKSDKSLYRQNDQINISLTLTNLGKLTGKEVVQIYVSKKKSSVERPEKELKNFKKIEVTAGKSVKVNLQVPVSSLAYYNVKQRKWLVEPGKYTLSAGKSSAEIQQSTTVTVR